MMKLVILEQTQLEQNGFNAYNSIIIFSPFVSSATYEEALKKEAEAADILHSSSEVENDDKKDRSKYVFYVHMYSYVTGIANFII